MNSPNGFLDTLFSPYFYYVLHSPVVCGALAGSGACLVSTPSEVVKTRLQLQGELVAKSSSKKVYSGFLHGFYTILRYEGLAGIYSGIAPAIYYQIVMNGLRFGSHKYIKDALCSVTGNTKPSYGQNVIASGIAGVLGAVVASPLYLIKVRLQASTKMNNIAVGYQHNYSGTLEGFMDTIRKEGVRGLWRGAEGQVLRVGSGSAVQISTYEQIRNYIETRPFFLQYPSLLPPAAALCTSIPLVITMNPVDVMVTRLYNQKVVNGKGVLYCGPFDCMYKTLKQEGLQGWYKGTVAHYMRLAPHTLTTFCIFEWLQKLGKREPR